ncbi:hypothetical protein VW29_06675 [Devosia limi DSM 17137]|uniref:Prophage maintenance system killer protein n=1 Tax=Devosia limi DSM 17137 TaxID=1121477 RepID=A0A0F5LT48_9HYPH|nr:hypothetical protein [Devosia limi]KKB85329.1 hypothetical protein VW29_06675 [Devosia limi DSM 17137]SHF93377.1 Prophage maintenance system killer protein [Devosia limi DSM 17137]
MDQSSTETFDLEACLSRIEHVSAELWKIPVAYFGPQGSKIPDIGWYVLAAVKKTASLSHAFCALIRAKNTLAAASLIRLQLDTAMRISGLALVNDVEAAGTHLMNDGSYRKLRSRDNKPLDDAVLHRRLDEYYPGLTSVYEATSSYVHLSASHIKTGLSEPGGTPTLFFHLKGTDDAQPDEYFAHMVDSFAQATELTAEMIEDFMRFRYAHIFKIHPSTEGHTDGGRSPSCA